MKRELGKNAFSFLLSSTGISELFDSMIFQATKCINIHVSNIKFIVTLISAVTPIKGTNTIFFTFYFCNYTESSTTHAKNPVINIRTYKGM